MCGRIAAYTPPPKLARALLAGIESEAEDRWRPSFNLPPAKRLFACRLGREGQRLLQPFGWGLIPRWAKDPRIGSKAFNARAETVATKPMFRQAFRKHRALVPVDGFYEWRRSESGKQPFFFSRADGELTVFAGLWECWEREGNGLYPCSNITTDAGEDMEDVHDRMPVILEPRAWQEWLDPGNDGRLRQPPSGAGTRGERWRSIQ